ncbi:MAG: Tol-Pal system beta propeller repeat protein TolB [Pseudomonadales bacterium]|jgi:TolB protein|nr:Tol-Pal system beta propeller repeat protein TolB [Pseudomonadales bacterium]
MTASPFPSPRRGVVACLLAVLLAGIAAGARAELAIEITQGVDDPVPMAVVPFGWRETASPPEDVGAIVRFDLARSGQFAMTAPQDMLSLPSREQDLFYRDWRVQGVSYVLIGSVERAAQGFAVTWGLYDVLDERRILGERVTASAESLRDVAHRISDRVYEQLTGIPGAFSTRILYVVAQNVATEDEVFRLEMADSDGARARTLLRSREPILSAAWSPDGRRVVYVSFESGKPAIYLQEIATGRREKLTDFQGLNGAPAFSPDGRSLAVVLSVGGNPDIYLLDLETRRLRQLTRHFGIDTEPSFSPDGRHVVFTSNRGGQPQIYRVGVNDGVIERLTFEGDYNARARMLADGRGLVFVHRRRGVFHIAYMDLERGDVSVLTETSLDESPSVAPNGSMVIYATRSSGRGILAVVSMDGRVKYRLPSTQGDVREPSWSPYLQ